MKILKFTDKDLWFRNVLHGEDFDFTGIDFGEYEERARKNVQFALNRAAHFMCHGTKHPVLRVYDEETINAIVEDERIKSVCKGFSFAVTPSTRSGAYLFPWNGKPAVLMYAVRFNPKYERMHIFFYDKEFYFFSDSIFKTKYVYEKHPPRKQFEVTVNRVRFLLWILASMEKYAEDKAFELLCQGKAQIVKGEGSPEEDLEIRDYKWYTEVMEKGISKNGYHLRNDITDENHEKKLGYEVQSIYGI